MAHNDDYPWEPPFNGTEVEHLRGALNRLRTTFRWKAGGLDRTGLSHRIGSSDLTLGNLLKHLATVEDATFTIKMKGDSIGEPWTSIPGAGGGDWPFTSAADDSPEQLYALWDEAVARNEKRFDEALASGGLDQPVYLTGPSDEPISLRRIIFDLVEEYGRHTGHADLIREDVDGLVGEDPPAGWRP